MSEIQAGRHIRADDARDLLERGGTVDDAPDPIEDLRPGLAAGHPTAFDAIGRSLLATRASAEQMIAGGMALVAQLDAALACLSLITPPEHREALRAALEGSGGGTGHPAPGAAYGGAQPPAPPGGTRGEKPRTFGDGRDRS